MITFGSRLKKLRTPLGVSVGVAGIAVVAGVSAGAAFAGSGPSGSGRDGDFSQDVASTPSTSANGPLGSLSGSSSSSIQETAPTTPPPTSSDEPPPPSFEDIPIIPRIAEVAAVEQDCRITIYYGPLHVGPSRSIAITVGEDHLVPAATETGDMGDGSFAFRITDSRDYRTHSANRDYVYYAMEVQLLDNGTPAPLDSPQYHLLGEVSPPVDGLCSETGREIPIG